jgi:GNAT superfamily N-acetyltransferase
MVRLFQRRESLSDGTEVVVRPIRPDDRESIRGLHARLSPRTRFLRFFAEVPELSPEILDYLTKLDYVDRYALVAALDDEIVGVARFDRISPAVAEVAVVVQDDLQGRGLGTVLMRRLMSAAKRRGITSFEGDVLPENQVMLELVQGAGGVVLRPLTEEAILADLNWPKEPTGPEAFRVHLPLAASPMRKLLRAMATTHSALLPPREVRGEISRLIKGVRSRRRHPTE